MQNKVHPPKPTLLESTTNMAKSQASKEKKFLISILASILLLAVVVAVCVTTKSNNVAKSSSQSSHSIIKSTCASTLYPDLCISSVKAALPQASDAIKSGVDVLKTALKYTITNVLHNHVTVKRLIERYRSLPTRQRVAIHDCLEMIANTLDGLLTSRGELEGYLSKNYTLSKHLEKVMTLLSAAQTNQDSCLDGFSHDRGDKIVRKLLIAGQTHVFKLCSNVLAMLKNVTGAESEVSTTDHNGWPKWLSAGDRRLLQASSVTADVTVAADGSGNFRTISQAVAAAPEGSSRRYVIRIKAGVYRENVEIPRRKINLMFVGDGRMNTIVTASKNVVDGSTTFNSATVAVVGDGFLARDITFQNAAGPSKHQAVALRVNADLTAFYRCSMIAYQDTLYVHSFRQFYTNCYIAGTIDFIFGNAAVVLQNCDIQARRPNPKQKNMVTAQGRSDPNQNTGIVIQKCKIGATSDLKPVQNTFPTYLGRPWKEYSRTVVMQTELSDVIHPAGWFEWDGNFALNTLYYGEYQNTGAGAGTENRVTWRGFRILSTSEAQSFTAGTFINGGNWLPGTGFPFSLGL